MIEVFTGLPGSGKSYALAFHVLKGLRAGRPVFVNMPVRGAYRLERGMLRDVMFPSDALLVIDEAGAWFNSREWKDMSMEEYVLFSQHRHLGWDLLMAVQHPNRLDKVIRELVNLWWLAEERRLWFVYHGYMDQSQWGLAEAPFSCMLWKRRRVFEVFDTYYMHYELERESCRFDLWDEIVGGEGKSRVGGEVENGRPVRPEGWVLRRARGVACGIARGLSGRRVRKPHEEADRCGSGGRVSGVQVSCGEAGAETG